MEAKEKEIELCGIHNWSPVRCDNKVEFHTLTYLPASKISSRSADDTETVRLCDECYEALFKYYKFTVASANDIKYTKDIVVK